MEFMRKVIKCKQSTYNFNPLWNDVSKECKDIETQEAEHRDPVFICNIKQWRFTAKKGQHCQSDTETQYLSVT